MTRILVLVVCLIVYGSLYPWTFSSAPGSNPVSILVTGIPLDRYAVRDIAINIALYVPLGAAAYLALLRRGWGSVATPASILLGVALSASVELIQMFQPARISSLLDVLMNAAGSCAGAAVGLVLASRPAFRERSALRRGDRVALLLLALWIGWLLFPLMPVPGRTVLMGKIRMLLAPEAIDFVPVTVAAATWLAAGRLIAEEGARLPVVWLAASTLLVPMQLLILNRQPQVGTFVGAWVGVALYAAVRRLPAPDVAAGSILLGAITLRALHPFHSSGATAPFQWVPFASVLTSSWHDVLPILLDKSFVYGSALWLLRAAGLRMWVATAAVTVIVGLTEMIQVRLPGRTPEITDPVMVILLAVGFVSVWRSRLTDR